MASPTTLQPLLPSILDRLIDEHPDVTMESAVQRQHSINDIKESVRRDLEWLLNTRHARSDLSNLNSEISTSCLTFGLPDLISFTAGEDEVEHQLRDVIQSALVRFEPRLEDVEVIIHEQSDEHSRVLQISICGVLRVEPHAERVVYNSVIEAPLVYCNVRAN